jgi:hypothetical protein
VRLALGCGDPPTILFSRFSQRFALADGGFKLA